ncbi:MAG: hypothetical protein JWR26_616 [Pedosphaera sp.]|nr:hypothetical protein [Pedosphaera sp.]
MTKSHALKSIIAAVVLIVGWQVVVKHGLGGLLGFDEIEWRGQKFKLKKKYFDYEAYKDDSNQLATNEVVHVKTAMLAAEVPKIAVSWEELRKSLRQMRFPGFGSSYNGAVKDGQGNHYILYEYEIPQTQEQRTLLYQVGADGSCRRVFDGVTIDHQNDHILGNSETKVENRKLIFMLDSKPYKEIAFDSP